MPEMKESVTLETTDGNVRGHADIVASIDHYPDCIMLASGWPGVFRFSRIESGCLIYRREYVVKAENFATSNQAA